MLCECPLTISNVCIPCAKAFAAGATIAIKAMNPIHNLMFLHPFVNEGYIILFLNFYADLDTVNYVANLSSPKELNCVKVFNTARLRLYLFNANSMIRTF